MNKIIAPEKMIRTTLGEFLSRSDFTCMGVYVLACYPSLGCLCVGISNDVLKRLREHTHGEKLIGQFVRGLMADACGWRLDILVAPDNDYEWCRQTERRLIEHFRPVFNTQHLGEVQMSAVQQQKIMELV
jgi:hypothetical protein